MKRCGFRTLLVCLSTVLLATGLWKQQGVSAQSWALPVPTGPDIFLRFLESYQNEDADTAEAYYTAVDPFNRRTTLRDWLVTTGFLESATTPWTGPGSPYPDVSTPAGDSNIRVDVANGGAAKATYVNGADLGFGRRMYLRTNPDGSLTLRLNRPVGPGGY